MTPEPTANLWLTYYADDFTGATDALERLELAGVRTALYMSPPTPEEVSQRPELRAIGVAGASRSLPTEQLAGTVSPALRSLRALGAPHVHYKVCSTFDSSPGVGSIGRVIDLASELFDAPFTPVLVGSPALNRWCVFGNLFADMGIGAGGQAYRLDRHPSMSKHPVTPMDEADLRVHLGRQTDKPIGLVDVRVLECSSQEVSACIEGLVEGSDHKVLLFDTLEERHLATIGETLDEYGARDCPLFWVGSSAVESALTAHWQSQGRAGGIAPPPASLGGPVLVLAGSCSPVTAEQVEQAERAGWQRITVSASTLSGETWRQSIKEVVPRVAGFLRDKQNVIVQTETPRPDQSLAASRLGEAYASLCQAVFGDCRPSLLVIAGGDTSSHTATALGVRSLEFVAPLTPGAPVCRAASDDPLVAGLPMVFKGGQVGSPDFLARLGHL